VAHDAIAVAYNLLQRHSDAFIGADGGGVVAGEGGIDGLTCESPAETMASLVLSLTRSLQQPTLSREAAISAGVTIAAAAGAGATAHAHAAVLADAFFPATGEGSGWLATAGVASPPIDALILGPTRGTSLAAEAARFTPFGRLSAIRGLLTAVPAAALSARMTPPVGFKHSEGPEDDERGWGLLLDGALPAICAAMVGLCTLNQADP
jgi:hypothetical protein